MLADKKILLVGCGKMGGALLNGWLKQPWCRRENIFVIEPNIVSPKIDKVNYLDRFENLKSYDFDICVLAIKPQSFSEAIPAYSRLKHDCMFVSIAAGKSVAEITALLSGEKRKIIRAMPNLPASIGNGVTGIYRNENVSNDEYNKIFPLFSGVGITLKAEQEFDIDKITALSGSGPAYFYYFIECLQKSAENLGFSVDTAKEIARQTAIGAINLLEKEGDAKTLREAVTSPKGTTEAGLSKLMDGRLQKLVDETIKAALDRAVELSGG